MDDSNSLPEIGDLLIDRYHIVDMLGHGGMGAVYLCDDTVAGTKCAVKFLLPKLTHLYGGFREVRRNFRLIYNLKHPNIAAINALEPVPGRDDLLVVMEYAPGEPLSEILKQETGASFVVSVEGLDSLEKIAIALDYAHSERVIHRDIKPSNVVVERSSGKVKVLDFGIAAAVEDTVAQTSIGTLTYQRNKSMGTPAYMAPEQWRGLEQTGKVDQYALAIVAFQMYAGFIPFYDTDPANRCMKVLNEPLPTSKRIHAAIYEVLSKATAKNPDHRYDHCVEFIDALRGAQAASDPETLPTGSMGVSVCGDAGRPRIHLGAIKASALVVTAGVVLLGDPGCRKKSAPSMPQEPVSREPVEGVIAKSGPVESLSKPVKFPAEPVVADKKADQPVPPAQIPELLTKGVAPEPFSVHVAADAEFQSVMNDVIERLLTPHRGLLAGHTLEVSAPNLNGDEEIESLWPRFSGSSTWRVRTPQGTLYASPVLAWRGQSGPVGSGKDVSDELAREIATFIGIDVLARMLPLTMADLTKPPLDQLTNVHWQAVTVSDDPSHAWTIGAEVVVLAEVRYLGEKGWQPASDLAEPYRLHPVPTAIKVEAPVPRVPDF